MVKNLRVKAPHHTARAQGLKRSSCAQRRCLFLGRVRENIELYSMHLGIFKEGTCIIGIALTVGELIGALRRPVPWLRCPPGFFTKCGNTGSGARFPHSSRKWAAAGQRSSCNRKTCATRARINHSSCTSNRPARAYFLR